MKVNKLKMQSLLAIPAKAGIALTFLFGLFAFFACTDYVADIDEQIEELEATIEYSSGGVSVKSSSSEKAPSSSETSKSSSSVKLPSSSEDSKSSSSVKSPSSSEDSKPSSSEKIESSSSSSRLNQFNPDIEYGELLDSRDGQTYKTVEIGSQTWMAENLNFKTDSSFCFSNDETNCITYGRLYTWTEATSACPSGWHLPSNDEWNTLFTAVGGASTAGPVLRATSGWYGNSNGSDDFGFSALPAGDRYNNGEYNGESVAAFFWSSTDYNNVGAYYISLPYYGNTELNRKGKDYGFSVRCLKGDASGRTAESSSSEAPISSSSSETTTTSSSNIAETSSSGKESWAYLNPAISYGEMVDSRDGQVYKTVVIGEQEWMAENLNYGTRVAAGTDQKYESIVERYCYNNDSIECKKYGALYQWTEAMQLPYDCWYNNCSNSNLIDIDGDGFHQGICPDEWHIPSQTEWESLFSVIGGASATTAKSLKSLTEWNNIGGNEGNGLDSYGFSALPSGMALNNGNYENKGQVTFFWSTKEYGTYQAYYVNLTSSGMGFAYHGKTNGISVRCIKDNPNNIIASSSSEDAESSSSKESWAYLNPAISYGEMTDDRDEQVYKTVIIGEQTWMAENLNFEADSSFCYSNEKSNCAKYGRLYKWAAAMDSAGVWGSNGKGCGYGKTCTPTYPVRGVCPKGWHLPSKTEWETLFTTVGDTSTAAKVLKSTSGWNDGGNGSDAFGFSALPAGYKLNNGNYSHNGTLADFWSSSAGSSILRAYSISLGYRYDNAYLWNDDNYKGYSVRCVKDD